MDIANRIEEGLQRFSVLVLEDPRLRAEFEASVTEFFGGPLPEGDARETLMAARRHVEWFMLERHSTSLFKTPVEGLADRWKPAVPESIREIATAFPDSFTGVFRVSSVVPGEGAWLRDLAGFGEHPVVEPAGGSVLEEGDIVVGRLFPVTGQGCHVSLAAAIFRDPNLLAAIERDLDRARREHAGSQVLHISQRELEVMFWRSTLGAGARSAPREDPVEVARRFLADGGLASEVIEEVVRSLAAQPFDATRFAHGAGDVLGEILDEFAFETSIDLTRAREVLTQAWAALSVPPTAAGSAGTSAAEAAPEGVRGALRTFEEGRRAGQDLDGLFEALERDLGLGGASDDDEESTPAPDFPGVISAMVEEFLWEVESVRGEPALRERYEGLRALGRFGESIGVFEALSANDLLRFTAFWLTERRELRDAQATRDLLEALDAFCAWAESAHEMNLKREFGETLEKLRSSLPRIVEANEALATEVAGSPQDPEDVGELYEIVAPAADADWRLRDRGGREHHARPPGELAPLVRPGDRLRGRIELDGRAVVYRLYPPEAAGLLNA